MWLPLNKYYCPLCKKFVWRHGSDAKLQSYCEVTKKRVILILADELRKLYEPGKNTFDKWKV